MTADDRAGTVILHLGRARPDVLQLLALPPYSVVPAATPVRPLTRPPIPATGPYLVVRSTPAEIDLARNPRFRLWSAQAQPVGFPDRIVWWLRISPATGLREVLSDRADVLGTDAPARDADRLATRYPTLFHLDPVPATEAFFLNTRRPPFDVPAVRQAVALAADRRRLAREEGPPEAARPACQVLPPGLPGYRPICPYTRDPAKFGTWSGPDLSRARALVRRAGATRASVVLAGPRDRPRVMAAVRQFAASLRSIGLRPRIVTRPVGRTGSYFRFIGAPGTPAQAGWAHWLLDRPDAGEFFDPLFTCAAARAPTETVNVARYCDPVTDAMIARAERLAGTDRAAAADAWAQVDARVTRSAAWVPFAGGGFLDVVSRRAQGYAYNPTYSILLDQLSVR